MPAVHVDVDVLAEQVLAERSDFLEHERVEIHEADVSRARRDQGVGDPGGVFSRGPDVADHAASTLPILQSSGRREQQVAKSDDNLELVPEVVRLATHVVDRHGRLGRVERSSRDWKDLAELHGPHFITFSATVAVIFGWSYSGSAAFGIT